MASQLIGEIKGETSTETVPCIQVEWKVPEDILLLPRDTEHKMHSPSFHFKDAVWCLRLTTLASTRKAYSSSHDTIGMHVVKKYPASSTLRIFYHIGIKTESGKTHQSYRSHDLNTTDSWGKFYLFSRSDISQKKMNLAPNGLVRFFCHFWEDTGLGSHSISKTCLSDYESTMIANQLSENIGEISTEIATTMYVEWQVTDIHLLLEDTEHSIRSSTFQFKDELWYLQATTHDTEFMRKLFFSQVYMPIDVHLLRTQYSSFLNGTLYAECASGIKLVDGDIYSVEHNERVLDKNVDCRMLTNLSRLDKNILEAPNGKVTFFCYFRLESPSGPVTGSKKMPEGNIAEEKMVPTVSSPSTLNWTPEKPKFSSGNIGEKSAAYTFSVSSPPVFTFGKQKPSTPTVTSKLSEDFKNLFISGEDSDLSIKVKDTEFRVHKNILRARSSVFHSMLSHDMVEKNSGTIDITDSEPEAFKIFLLYLYNGCVENLSSDTVFDVCRAADKYDAEELKLKCKDFMLTNLSVDAVCDVIDHALQYNQEDLLKTATDFFSKNFKNIILTVKWQSFLKNNIVAANELLIKASNYYVLKE